MESRPTASPGSDDERAQNEMIDAVSAVSSELIVHVAVETNLPT